MKTKVIFFIIIMSSLTVQAQTVMKIHQPYGIAWQIPMDSIDSITYSTGNLASVITTNPTSISGTFCISGGIITNSGGVPIENTGVCYSTSPSPTTAGIGIVNNSLSDTFTCYLNGLSANTTYYVRAFATNLMGTTYGNEISFTTIGGIETTPGAGVIYNGYNYASIILGNGQEWITENLKTTTFANGDSIPNITDSLQWINLTTGAWAYYNNDNQNENPYGKLYNWYAVEDQRNLCPVGWHIPTDEEFMLLSYYLDLAYSGGKMKSTGTQYWQNPNTDASNESGFSGLPGGCRNYFGTFNLLSESGFWWTSSYAGTDSMWCYTLKYSDRFFTLGSSVKSIGQSVRCLKD